MKVRIIKQPNGDLHGVSLNCYKVGCVYDMPATLAGYLVVEGFAQHEMRKNGDVAGHANPERRKTPPRR